MLLKLVATDEHSGYRLLREGDHPLPHEVINHSSGKYVRGNVHTNSIDQFLEPFEARHHWHLSQGQQGLFAALPERVSVSF